MNQTKEDNAPFGNPASSSAAPAPLTIGEHSADEVEPNAGADRHEFAVGDLVFAKYGMHPHWPATIQRSDGEKTYWQWYTHDQFFVRFVDDGTAAWVLSENVKLFNPDNLQRFKCPPEHPQHPAQLKAIDIATDKYNENQLRKEKMEHGEAVEMDTASTDDNVDFQLHDLVMAQAPSSPFWPGIIGKCTWEREQYQGRLKLTNPLRYWVYFPSDDTANWIEAHNIRRFDPQQVGDYICDDNEEQKEAIEQMKRLQSGAKRKTRNSRRKSKNE